ncbi:hypothetical protein OQA88_4036 [Cercophora sp. LCS_1]
MEQTKALNALEPFLALSKSANSPRAAADLVVRATSAPNTFVFAELFETPQIQALGNPSDDDAKQWTPYYDLLRVFCYGTYASIAENPSLPPLNDAQKLKLRQLSLLTIAREVNQNVDPSNPALSYPNLIAKLELSNAQGLEELVISAIYAGLVEAQLDPKNKLVRINRVAPLRDVEPTAIGGLLSSLQAWASRCGASLQSLESEMDRIRANADRRAAREEEWSERVDKLVGDEKKGGRASDRGARAENLKLTGVGNSSFANLHAGSSGGVGARPTSASGSGGLTNEVRNSSKRGSSHIDEPSDDSDIDEAMDVDDDEGDVEGKKRTLRRKLKG